LRRFWIAFPPEPEEPEELELELGAGLLDGAGLGAGFSLFTAPPSAPTMLLTVCPRLMPPSPALDEPLDPPPLAVLVEVADGTETVFEWLVFAVVAGLRAVSAALSLQAPPLGGPCSPGGTPPPGSGTQAVGLEGSFSLIPG
jgi:hypothetical protein